MNKWIVMSGVALALYLAAAKARSAQPDPASRYAFSPQNWKTLPGYTAAQGSGWIA